MPLNFRTVCDDLYFNTQHRQPPMSPRFRACEACHSLKTKCDVSASNPNACERCVRFDLECIPAARKWQRDRIEDLEEQVRELTGALREARSSNTGSASTRETSVVSMEGVNRSATVLETAEKQNEGGSLESFLDRLVTEEQQASGLSAFKIYILPSWPAILLNHGDSWETSSRPDLSSISPILLLTILGFALLPHHTDITPETQNELQKKAMATFGAAAVGFESPSHELIQAILVAAYWYRPAIDASHGNCFQLVRTATELAIEFGLGGPNMLSSAPAWFSRFNEPLTPHMKGTWLACYVASTLSDFTARRPLSHCWSPWHQQCFNALAKESDSSTRLLLQFVGVARVHETIALKLGLCDLSVYYDITTTDDMMDSTPQWLKSDVKNITDNLGSPPALENQHLQFWRHIANVHINEPVLHTPTNKSLFAAPYIAQKIGAKDFASPPIITAKTEKALLSLTSACHDAINVVAHMAPEKILALPSLCFAPAVSYALSILIKIHVSVSAPGNTYIRVLSREDLRLRSAMWKLKAVNVSLRGLDPGMASWSTRIIGSVEWLEHWLDDYEDIVKQYEVNNSNTRME